MSNINDTFGRPMFEKQLGSSAADLLELIARLKAENDRLQDTISKLCIDWGWEHTHLQELCIAAGYTQEEITECDPMLSIQDLADLLAKKIPR